MAIEYNPVKMATVMMTSALSLLDEAGESDAAVKLQHAISIVTREAVPTMTDPSEAAGTAHGDQCD